MSTPTLGAVMNAAIRERMAGLRVALPGRVLAYDADKRRAEVQPLIAEASIDEAGERVVEPAPVIVDVPVIMPGAGGVRVKFPVSVGDTVLLVFASSAIDRWLAAGGTDVDPGNDRHHELTDAIAIPGLDSFVDVGDASPMIEFTATGQIQAGGDKALALKSDVDNLRTLVGAINTGAPGPLVNTLGPAWLATATVGTTILKGA